MKLPATARRAVSNYWVKLLAQNALGLLPNSFGARANLALAQAVQGRMAERPTAQIFRVRRSIRNIRLMREHAGFRAEGARVLELGTGWRAADPAIFHVLGAEEVVTLDHQRWLRRDSFVHSVEMLESARAELLEEAGGAAADAGRRLDELVRLVRSDLGLDEILAKIGVRYLVSRTLDLSPLRADGKRFDAFYSESVLHRIPAASLRARLQVIAGELLRPGAASFHRTDQRDINTLEHIGNSVWALNYLRHSDLVFDRFLSGKFTSQNRHRESDFIRLLEDVGISTRFVESRLAEGDVEKVARMRLAARFRQKTPEDVAVRCSLLVGVYGCAPDGPPVRERVLGSIREIES